MAHAGHPRRTRTREEQVRGFIIHFVIFLVVNIGLAWMNLTRNPHHLWFYWVAVGWGLGVAGHAFGVFGRSMTRHPPGRNP